MKTLRTCSKAHLQLDEYQEADESSSSSSSSDETSDMEEVLAEEQTSIVGDPVTEPAAWEPDVRMYQHKRSSIVHVIAACVHTKQTVQLWKHVDQRLHRGSRGTIFGFA